MFNLFKTKSVVDPMLPMVIPQPAVVEPKEEIIDLGPALGDRLMLTCKGCTKLIEGNCSVYARPWVISWHRHGQFCPFNPEKLSFMQKELKKLNPLKASKRGNH